MAEKRSWLKITAEYFYRSISLRSTSLSISTIEINEFHDRLFGARPRFAQLAGRYHRLEETRSRPWLIRSAEGNLDGPGWRSERRTAPTLQHSRLIPTHGR